jgi:hypothetical protein
MRNLPDGLRQQQTIQVAIPQERRASMRSDQYKKEFYSEAQAAKALGISLTRLYMLLDEHIFNEGKARPAKLSFCASDLLLLEFWHRAAPNAKVFRMPRRS